jgi:hypothetical protein
VGKIMAKNVISMSTMSTFQTAFKEKQTSQEDILNLLVKADEFSGLKGLCAAISRLLHE